MLELYANHLPIHHTIDTPHSNNFHRHMHNEYELLYFVRGNAEYIIEGSVYKLRPGDLLFIHPRKFHYLKPISDAPYERFVIHFGQDTIPESLHDFINNSKEIYRISKGSFADKFFEMWTEAEAMFSDNELKEYLKNAFLTVLLCLKYLPDEDKIAPIRQDMTLESILKYIDSHPAEQLTADALSAKFFISTSWIVHMFKKNLGISLMQYIHKKRILYAEELLHGGMTPTEVAKLCNYDSYSTFYRQYNKILGYSPAHTYSESRAKEKA